MSSFEKMREAFERNLSQKLKMTYEEVKARMDEYEKITGYRYGKNGQNYKDWAIWCEAWQSRQAEIDELSSQNQILKEVAESDTKTIERLESVINLNDSELKDKDKRIEMFLGVVEKHKRYIPHSTIEAFKNALGVGCD
jgi:hypothetical protein